MASHRECASSPRRGRAALRVRGSDVPQGRVAALAVPDDLLCGRVSRSRQRRLREAADDHRSGSSDAVYGFGAGIFFFGYFIFEMPSNVILHNVGARVWIARIMIIVGHHLGAHDVRHHADHVLRDALSARRGRSGLLPRHHPVSHVLVSGASARAHDDAVHDGDRDVGRDRRAGVGLDHEVLRRRERLARLAVAVPARRDSVDRGRHRGVHHARRPHRAREVADAGRAANCSSATSRPTTPTKVDMPIGRCSRARACG